jgi:hypothetical protein
MKGIDEMEFYTERQRDSRHVGRVREFRDIRSRPRINALDAISETVELTSERMREIEESRDRAARS